MQPEQCGYWVVDWLEANGVRSEEDIARLSYSRRAIEQAVVMEQSWRERHSYDQGYQQIKLIAGAGLNLFDEWSCPNPACRRAQIDRLFRHAWHYFDKVVLPDAVGPAARRASEAYGTKDFSQLRLYFSAAIQVVYYLRQIGAVDLVEYFPEDAASTGAIVERMPADLDSGPMKELEQALTELISEQDLRIGYSEEFRKPVVEYRDRVSSITMTLVPKTDKAADPRNAARYIVRKIVAALAKNLHQAKTCQATLGAYLWAHREMLKRMSQDATCRDIAFELQLPNIDRVPLDDLIRIRKEEGDAFLRFRSALTRGLKEYSGASMATNCDPRQEIVGDIIQPELSRLNDRLRSAKRALAKKSLGYLGLGVIGATCGIIFGAPIALVLSGGVGLALSGGGEALSKYCEQRNELEQSDMYFLWETMEHAHKK